MGLMQDFIRSIESARMSQPSIGTFNNPAFGQDDKSLGFVRAEDNFECPRKMLFDLVEKVASIATISPDNGESLVYSNDFRECQRRSITIRYCSIGNCEGNDKAERINWYGFRHGYGAKYHSYARDENSDRQSAMLENHAPAYARRSRRQ